MYTWAYIHVQDKLVSIRVPCMYNRWKVEFSMISLIQGVNTKRWSDVTLIPLSPAATKNGICLRLSLFLQNCLQYQKKNKQEVFFTTLMKECSRIWCTNIWSGRVNHRNPRTLSSEPFLPLHDISINYTGTYLFGLYENQMIF